jgi:hypothetical protein
MSRSVTCSVCSQDTDYPNDSPWPPLSTVVCSCCFTLATEGAGYIEVTAHVDGTFHVYAGEYDSATEISAAQAAQVVAFLKEPRAQACRGPKIMAPQKSIQDVCDAITSAKIRAMCPRVEDDGIAVPLVDGISYTQLAQLSAAIGTAEIYVDVVPGDSGSASVPGRDHAVLTIKWP